MEGAHLTISDEFSGIVAAGWLWQSVFRHTSWSRPDAAQGESRRCHGIMVKPSGQSRQSTGCRSHLGSATLHDYPTTTTRILFGLPASASNALSRSHLNIKLWRVFLGFCFSPNPLFHAVHMDKGQYSTSISEGFR